MSRARKRWAGVVSCGLCLLFMLGGGALPAQQPPPKPKPAPPPTKVAKPAKRAALLLVADAPCRLSVDGEEQGELAADEARKVELTLGEHLVLAVSTEESEVRFRQVVVLEESRQKVVDVALRSKVDGVRAARADERRRQEEDDAKRRAEEQRLAGLRSRFQETASGVLRDSKSSLEWTARDNGSDIDWQGASRYCESLSLAGRIDWRLPRVDELKALFVRDFSQPCGASTCHLYPQFDLTEYVVWSGTRNGGSAFLVHFVHGATFSHRPVLHGYRRALCVRASRG